MEGNFRSTPGVTTLDSGGPGLDRGRGSAAEGGDGWGAGYTPIYTDPSTADHWNRRTKPYNDPNRWPTTPNRNNHNDPPTPMMPVNRQTYPTPPWPKRYTTRRTTTIATTTTTTTTTLPPKFCSLERPGQPVKYIREGYKKRLYKHDDPECSELCECNMGDNLECKVLECIERSACNTGIAFYSHSSPFYDPHKGQCLCYSGTFVCSKPPKEVELNLPQGVYLFLGFSLKDEQLLKAITNQGAADAWSAIQGLVSYHNVNNNKSECRINMLKQSEENLILQAVMDEFEENREKGNLTAEILNREKDECYEALVSISRKINTNDADMRSHVVLSMFKVAAAEADVPPPPASAASKLFHMFNAGPGGSTGAISLEVIILFNALIILIRNSNCQTNL